MIGRRTCLLGLAMQTILQNEIKLLTSERGSNGWIAREANAIVNAVREVSTDCDNSCNCNTGNYCANYS